MSYALPFRTKPTSSDWLPLQPGSQQEAHVHVLAPGMKATDGWADAALSQFGHATAAVAPLIRGTRNSVLAAGWSDQDSLLQPVGYGKPKISRRQLESVIGPYFQASFWRRDLLDSVIAAFQSACPFEATYAFTNMLSTAGWYCDAAPESVVYAEDLPQPERTYETGKRLQSIRNVTSQRPSTPSLTQLLLSVLRPKRFLETLGRRQATPSVVAKQINQERIPEYQQARKFAAPRKQNLRRAA